MIFILRPKRSDLLQFSAILMQFSGDWSAKLAARLAISQFETKFDVNCACFPQEKTPEFPKKCEIHELFVSALCLVWFAGATPDSFSISAIFHFPISRDFCVGQVFHSVHGFLNRKPCELRNFCVLQGSLRPFGGPKSTKKNCKWVPGPSRPRGLIGPTATTILSHRANTKKSSVLSEDKGSPHNLVRLLGSSLIKEEHFNLLN